MTLQQPQRLRKLSQTSLDNATRVRQDGRELSLARSLYQLLWNSPDYLNHTAHIPTGCRFSLVLNYSREPVGLFPIIPETQKG
jgi:hypothetical protein